MQLELERDLIDAFVSVFFPVNFERTETLAVSNPIPPAHDRAVLGQVGDDEIHHAPQPSGGRCARDAAKNCRLQEQEEFTEPATSGANAWRKKACRAI